jgi:hypothetical protein
MNTIAVIDPCDDTPNTAFVNELHDRAQRRAVVHAPASSDALVDEILRALHCDNANGPPVRASQRQEWAAAWICAFDRLELIVYGAWRLKPRDLRWLRILARRPTVRLWLVSHDQAGNLPDLLAIADATWSWEQFHGYWRTRARNQRRRTQRTTANEDEHPSVIDLDAPGPLAFWPWAIPQMLLSERGVQEAMHATNRLSYGVRYDAANPMRLAVRLHRLFSEWRAPAQRRFVLMTLKNALFSQHLWLDWDPALTRISVPRRSVQVQPRARRAADPALAASAVIATSAHELGADGEFRIGGDGSHVLLETGETIAIAGPDRPALRAFLTVTGSPHGQLLKQPHATDETIAQPNFTAARTIPALSQIAGLIEVRPLVMRVNDDAEPLTIRPTDKSWNCLKPAKLDYRHTAVLSHLLRCLQRDEYPREPLRGSTPDDLQVLHDLYHYGLVIDGAHGRTELEQWARMLWHHGRVTMPPPSSIRA